MVCGSYSVGELHCGLVAVWGVTVVTIPEFIAFWRFLVFGLFCVSKKKLITAKHTAAKPFAFAHFAR